MRTPDKYLMRYRELQRILDQLELALTMSCEELHKLEYDALRDKVIYVRDENGEWQMSELTDEEQAILLVMDEPTIHLTVDDEVSTIVQFDKEALAKIWKEIEKRSAFIKKDPENE